MTMIIAPPDLSSRPFRLTAERRIADLMFHSHPLSAGIISCLLLQESGVANKSQPQDQHAAPDLLDDILALSDLETPR
jgi:hypothetical protein